MATEREGATRIHEAGVRGLEQGAAGALGVSVLLLGLVVMRRRPPASLPMIGLRREAYGKEFTLRETLVDGLAVYRPIAATRRGRDEMSGRVIMALPDYATPGDFATLAKTLANAFNRFDVQMIGSPYDPLVTEKGGWMQARRYGRWARGAELQVHRRLMSDKAGLYPGRPLILIGVADGGRHTLRALADLETYERTAVRRVILVAPSTKLYPTGHSREPRWMQSARRRDHELFDRQLGRGGFSGLGARIEVVSTIGEKDAPDKRMELRGQLGLGKEPTKPVMARPGEWEVAKQVIGLIHGN